MTLFTGVQYPESTGTYEEWLDSAKLGEGYGMYRKTHFISFVP